LHVVALSILLFGPHAGERYAERKCDKIDRSGHRSRQAGRSDVVAAVMVQVDVEHDSEGRVELAIGLADRFQAALIGVAGCALWPAFMAGDVELSK